MKTYFKAVRASVWIVTGLLVMPLSAFAQAVSLGAAQNVTILGGSSITNTGLTIINGNLALSPGSALTGFPPGMVTNGTININNALAVQAHADTFTAYTQLAGQMATTNLSGIDLGTQTLLPGVYKFDSTAGLTGTLKLDNTGNANAVFVFQIGTGLTTASASQVMLLGSLTDPNIFWQVGSSATIGDASVFNGNILALTSITLDPGATIGVGRALAINGAVTMAGGGNTINVGGPGAVIPLVAVGAFWNGGVSNLWSGVNWSPDTTGTTSMTLTSGADVVFSVTGVMPQNQNTTLDVDTTISSFTVNDPVPVTVTGPHLLTIFGANGALSTLTINAGAGPTTINSNLQLSGLSQGITVNNAAGLTINGVVDGTIGLTKAGTGGLVLTGANTYTGGTLINAGTLAVGDLTSLHVSTALSSGNVTNLGTLETTASLGGSTEKIIVASAYTQTAGANLLLQVVNSSTPTPSNSTGVAGTNYDTLTVNGIATLGGSLTLNFQPTSVPSQGQRYVAVTAGTPLGTQFNTTTTNLPAPYFTVTTYNDTFGGSQPVDSAIVSLFRPFGSFLGLTPNQVSVANNIDANLTFLNRNGSLAMPTGVNADFFNNIVTGLSLASYNPGSLGSALDELSPQRFEILRNVAFDNYAFDVQSLDDEFARERNGPGGIDTAGFTFNDGTLGTQLSQIRSRLLAWSPAPTPGLLSDTPRLALGGVEMSSSKDMKAITHEQPLNSWNGFIDGGVDLGDLEHNADVSHSSYTTGRVRGGIDYRVSTNVRVGALFGYSNTDAKLDNEGSKTNVDSYTPGLYATYADKKGFFANSLFTYTRNDYSTDRKIIIPGVNRTASGSPGGNQFGGNIDGGYEFHRNNWTFVPSAGLTYVNLGIDSFNETGAGAANLSINNQSAESLRSRLGGTVQYRAKIGSLVLTPHLSAFWQHEFLDGPTLISSQFQGLPAGSFSVQTTRGDSDNALLGFGIDADVSKNVTLFVDYQSEVGGSSFFGQSASAGVKVGF